MSSWSEERRLNRAADREEERKDRTFNAGLARNERRADRDEKRQDSAQKRRERAQRKQQRAAKREKTLKPENIYRKGTLVLVALSAAASLPAQILHFVSISWMLFPIGPALEGAAWVMAAGVAYADEKKLPMWVRWLLRVLSMAAAGYAANVNYQYGQSLAGNGLTEVQAQAVAIGLSSVTLGGPLFFEVRQWVITLSASAVSPKQKAEEKARRKHDRKRRRTFKAVAQRQKELILAAPYNTLKSETAFERAWWDVHGAPVGVTADVIEARLLAEFDVAEAVANAEHSPEQVAVEMLLQDLFGPPGGDGGGSTATSTDGPDGGPRGGGAKGRTALGGKGKRASRGEAATEPQKPLDEADLKKVRKLADALGGTERLSARNVREAVGCRNEYAVRLRDAVREERGDEQ